MNRILIMIIFQDTASEPFIELMLLYLKILTTFAVHLSLPSSLLVKS